VAAGHEIERKFLVSAMPDHPGPGIRILQGYLPLTGEDTELRVRRKGDDTVLTVKRGHGLDRGEQEVAISSEVFETLWPLTEGRRIEKTRYELPHGDATIELDEFGGELEGLLVAEVEFDSAQASELFEEAEWLGREVTEDPDYANLALAEHGRPSEL
jgi:CYTH domain-containing protein